MEQAEKNLLSSSEKARIGLSNPLHELKEMFQGKRLKFKGKDFVLYLFIPKLQFLKTISFFISSLFCVKLKWSGFRNKCILSSLFLNFLPFLVVC